MFEKLKKRFITELVLVISDLDKEIRVEVDKLDFAIDRVLSMKYKDKKQRLVAYILKLLNKVERNYEIHNKNLQENLSINCYNTGKYTTYPQKNLREQIKISRENKHSIQLRFTF